MSARELAMNGMILRGVVGSTAHGTGIDGQEDRDEMGVCIEPPEYVCGLEKFEQYIYRDKPEGVRSEAGDLDLMVYSLRKFVRLATKGNPSVLVLLWLPEYMTQTILGRDLVAIRDAFVSAEAGRAFLGYLSSQKMRLTGERSKKVSRPELVERYGYDTKFAMHALRLGLQGIDYLRDRHLWVPVQEPNRSILLDVRHGRVTFRTVLNLIEGAETELKQIMDQRGGWKADRDRINRFLVDVHQEHWAAS